MPRLTRSTLSLMIVSTLLVSTHSYAEIHNARNTGMGGVGVASSRFDAAESYNPALLTRKKSGDRVALVTPSVGGEVADEVDVYKTLDDYDDLYDRTRVLVREIRAAIVAADVAAQLQATADANRLKDEIVSMLTKIDLQRVRGNASALFSVAVPSDDIAFALSATTYGYLTAFVDYDPTDETRLQQAIDNGDESFLDNLASYAQAYGVTVSEVSLSLAKEFDLNRGQLSVGLRPKFQNIDTYFYRQAADSIDVSDFNAANYRKSFNDTNLDLGVAYYYSEAWTAGLSLRNLISKEYDTITNAGRTETFQIGNEAVAGVSYQNSFFNAAFDLDLLPIKGFKSDGESQFLRAGIELNAMNWAQLRLGARSDTKSNQADAVTAGINLSPFDTLHLGVSYISGKNRTFGGAIDLKLTF